MLIKQLSVFIENREGRLLEVTDVLAKHDVNIVTLSLADTSEYGILRIIVSDPEKGREVLKEAGISAKFTEVIAVQVPNKSGELQHILKVVSDAGSNIEYMYVLSTGINSSVIVKVTDTLPVIEALKKSGVTMYTAEEVYRFQA